MNKAERKESLMPNGIPRYIRCYDNSKSENATLDCYTVVFTGRYRHKTGGEFWHLSMNSAPFHPQGIGMHGSSPTQIDTPTYGHLGKKIPYCDLPDDCRKLVKQDYKYLWDIDQPKEDA